MGPKLEDFEVISTIGSGSHGTVRKVRRRQDKQVLVWKELNYGSMSESQKQGLVTEVNLLRELRHPNVVKFLHHIVERKTTTLYILMEYCPGGDLKHLITKCRQTSTFLEEGFIWRVLKQVCEALKVCHSRELHGGRIILHRDIKPANVFLDADGNVKLGDFGLARTLNSEASFATTFVGTPYYMSPEVINGQEYNEKSDMWSLGCLIYELCALHTPFEANTHKQLAAKIREARYDCIPIQYSSDLQEVLGLLLTYEDFLRPTALMIIHHSALKARMSTGSEEEEEDPLCHSLNPSVLLSSRNKERSSGAMEDDTVSREKIPSETEGPRILAVNKSSTNDIIRVDDVSMEVIEMHSKPLPTEHMSPLCETYDVESGKVKEKILVSDSNNSYDGIPCHDVNEFYEKDADNDADLETSIEEVYRVAKELARRPRAECRSPVITEMDLAKPECACGGMSSIKWRERVLALREAEAAVRERELDMKEREREVIHREHRVATMEREARQHLVRAQIYLKQSRHRKNAATSPNRPPSDLDTSVSADVGDEDVQTIAKLDPHRIDNPFLKMRGLQVQPEKRVSFEEENQTKFKSNTLDNPKSRRKRGNIFGLVDRFENKKDFKEETTMGVAAEQRIPLQPVSVNDNVVGSLVEQQNQRPKGLLPASREKTNTLPKQNSFRQRKNSKENVVRSASTNVGTPGLQQRCRSSENLSRRSVESSRNKENIPVQVTKGKKQPEVKECLRTLKTTTSNRVFDKLNKKEAMNRKGQKVQALQFYNVV